MDKLEEIKKRLDAKINFVAEQIAAIEAKPDDAWRSYSGPIEDVEEWLDYLYDRLERLIAYENEDDLLLVPTLKTNLDYLHDNFEQIRFIKYSENPHSIDDRSVATYAEDIEWILGIHPVQKARK